MEFFSKLMTALGVWNRGVDVVGNLPVEIAEMIFQNLDSRSLLNAAKVSTKWMAICRGSFRLRQTAKRYLRKVKRGIKQDEGIPAKRTRTSATSRLARMNNDLFQRVYLHRNPNKHLKFVDGITKKRIRSCVINSRFPPSPPRTTNISTRSLLRLR